MSTTSLILYLVGPAGHRLHFGFLAVKCLVKHFIWKSTKVDSLLLTGFLSHTGLAGISREYCKTRKYWDTWESTWNSTNNVATNSTCTRT